MNLDALEDRKENKGYVRTGADALRVASAGLEHALEARSTGAVEAVGPSAGLRLGSGAHSAAAARVPHGAGASRTVLLGQVLTLRRRAHAAQRRGAAQERRRGDQRRHCTAHRDSSQGGHQLRQ